MSKPAGNGKLFFPMRILVYLSGWEHVAWYIAILGLGMSLLFCFVIFPGASESQYIPVDPDRHGDLAYGLLQYGSFSYYPETEPSVERGPLYPAFIAVLLWASHDWWPYVIQLAQAFIMAGMCVVVFWTSERLWSRPVAVLTAGICAVHPVAIWYTGRVWIETMSMFLFTAIIAGTLYFTLKPNAKRAVLLGGILGAAPLCKSVFLPYVFLVPFLMWMLKKDRGRLGLAAVAMLCAIVVIAPWTIRNWKLTGRFIPVHARMGYNLEIGDEFVKHIRMSPWAIYRIWYPVSATADAKARAMPQEVPRWQQELWLDSELMKVSLDRYRRHPAFLLKKIVVNAWLFWVLGVTPTKTAAIGSMMLLLVLFTIISTVVVWKRGQMRTIMGVHLTFILVYYGMHLPVEAIARYSVVLVPAMIMYGVGPMTQAWLDRRSDEGAASEAMVHEEKA